MSSAALNAETRRDLAPASPWTAVPPEHSPKHSPGLRFRASGASGLATSAERDRYLKALARDRASRLYQRNPRARSVKAERGCCESVGALQLGLAMALLSLALVTLLAVFHSTASPPVEAATKGKEVCRVGVSLVFVILPFSWLIDLTRVSQYYIGVFV